MIVPLINLMNETQLGYDILQMDETTVQVLKEPGRAARLKSYMWVRRGGPPSRPVILFDYDPSRSGAVPFRLLADFKGTLQTDGYEGYAATAARDDIIHVGCLAHARRKFDEAVKAQAKTGRGGLAKQGFELIQCFPIGEDRDAQDAVNVFEVTVPAVGTRRDIRWVAYAEVDCGGESSEPSEDRAIVFFGPPNVPVVEE